MIPKNATITVDHSALNRCARRAHVAAHNAREVQFQALELLPTSTPEEVVQIKEEILAAAREADSAAQDAYLGLLALGAEVPVGAPKPQPIPLEKLDTPDSRELLDLLRRAQEVAERVDASRGRSLPDSFSLQPGESRGTDLAEKLSQIVLRVRLEVEGPQGRD